MKKHGFLFFVLTIFLFSCSTSNSGVKKEKTDKVTDSAAVKKSELDLLNDEVTSGVNLQAALIKRGDYFFEIRNMEKANNDFHSAFQLDSNNTEAILALAEFLPYTGDAENAYRLYNKVLSEKGKHKRAFLGLAQIHALLNNTKQALSFADSALVMDKHYRDAYMLKAMVFRNAGKFKETVSSYQTAIEQDSKYIPAYVALGNVYASKENATKEDYTMSENYFNSALDIDSTDKEALYGAGMLLQNLQRNDEALKMYAKIIEVDPKFSTALFNQGYIYLNQKTNLDSAKYFFQEVIKVDSMYFQAYHNLGEANRLAGDIETAKSHYLSALRINPEFELSKEAVQNLYK